MKKNFKFLLLSALCVVAFSLSSCLNSNDNNSGTYPAIVRVSYNLGTPEFIDALGNVFIPSSMTINGTTINPSEGDIAYIGYTVKSSTPNVSNSAKTYSVTLNYYCDLETYNSGVITSTWGAANDSVNKFHFAQDSLVTTGNVPACSVSMFGSHLLACLNYYPNSGNGNYNHVFYYTDQSLSQGKNNAPDTLKVWLCHHSIGNLLNGASYNYAGQAPYIYYFGYNLTNALANAEGQEASLLKRDSVVVDLKAKVASSYGNKAAWSDNCCVYKFN
jgi:hypothetical protein